MTQMHLFDSNMQWSSSLVIRPVLIGTLIYQDVDYVVNTVVQITIRIE
jgi:hypothetical protein